LECPRALLLRMSGKDSTTSCEGLYLSPPKASKPVKRRVVGFDEDFLGLLLAGFWFLGIDRIV